MSTYMTVTDEIAESNALLADLASKIASELPGEWTCKDRSTLVRVSDGLEIYMTQPWNKRGPNGKLEIKQAYKSEAWKIPASGEYADPTDYNTVLPSIGASASKSPDKIARDIVRRLLPDAEAMHTKALERVSKSSEYHDTQAANMAALGLEPQRGDRGAPRYEADLGSYAAGGPRATVKTYTDDVSIELSGLTVEEAKAVLAALTFRKGSY
jgi:hypothetical protein